MDGRDCGDRTPELERVRELLFGDLPAEEGWARIDAAVAGAADEEQWARIEAAATDDVEAALLQRAIAALRSARNGA